MQNRWNKESAHLSEQFSLSIPINTLEVNMSK